MVTPIFVPPDEAARNEAHNEKMRKIKAAREKLMATKTEEKRTDCCPYRGRQGKIIIWLWHDYALYRPSDALCGCSVYKRHLADRGA